MCLTSLSPFVAGDDRVGVRSRHGAKLENRDGSQLHPIPTLSLSLSPPVSFIRPDDPFCLEIPLHRSRGTKERDESWESFLKEGNVTFRISQRAPTTASPIFRNGGRSNDGAKKYEPFWLNSEYI